jgi:di/tricarboxylate transporter
VLLLVGSSPRLILLGFMLPTALLSMWIREEELAVVMQTRSNKQIQSCNNSYNKKLNHGTRLQ